MLRQDPPGFLLFLLTHSGLRLTRAQYRRIWDHLVGGELVRQHRHREQHQHSGLRLTRAQYRRIWDHLVGGALCREEMDLCYVWLLRGSIPPHFSTSDGHYRLYNQQDQRYLFDNCIRRLPAAHLSATATCSW